MANYDLSQAELFVFLIFIFVPFFSVYQFLLTLTCTVIFCSTIKVCNKCIQTNVTFIILSAAEVLGCQIKLIGWVSGLL